MGQAMDRKAHPVTAASNSDARRGGRSGRGGRGGRAPGQNVSSTDSTAPSVPQPDAVPA